MKLKLTLYCTVFPCISFDRFTIKAPQTKPRKDRFLDNVIISEKKDNTITKHQVNSLHISFKDIAEL